MKYKLRCVIEKAFAKPLHMFKNDEKAIAKVDKDIKDRQKKLQNIGDVIIKELENL